MQGYASQGYGIAALTLLLNSANGGAPTVNDASAWKQNYGLASVYVAADPTFAMVPGSSVGTPQISVVDPRTMLVVHLQEGWGGSHPPQLLQVAQANQSP